MEVFDFNVLSINKTMVVSKRLLYFKNGRDIIVHIRTSVIFLSPEPIRESLFLN